MAQSDRVFLAVMDIDLIREKWTIEDVMEELEIQFGDDVPSRRTVRNRLNGLDEVGILRSEGGGGRTYKKFDVSPEYVNRRYDPSDGPCMWMECENRPVVIVKATGRFGQELGVCDSCAAELEGSGWERAWERV